MPRRRSHGRGDQVAQLWPGPGEPRVQREGVDRRYRHPTQLQRLVLGSQSDVGDQLGQHRGVDPAAVVVLELTEDADGLDHDAGLLLGLAQRCCDGILVAVPGAARHPPGVAGRGPRGPMLQQHRGLVGVAAVDQQQPGRAVPSPVPMTVAAPDPAVPVMLHAPSVHDAGQGAPATAMIDWPGADHKGCNLR